MMSDLSATYPGASSKDRDSRPSCSSHLLFHEPNNEDTKVLMAIFHHELTIKGERNICMRHGARKWHQTIPFFWYWKYRLKVNYLSSRAPSSESNQKMRLATQKTQRGGFSIRCILMHFDAFWLYNFALIYYQNTIFIYCHDRNETGAKYQSAPKSAGNNRYGCPLYNWITMKMDKVGTVMPISRPC